MKALRISSLLALLFLFALPTKAQFIKTSLTITVIDGTGNAVEGATVQLFEKEEDYLKEQNVAAEGVSEGPKGQIKFKDLKNIAYFVIVRKDDMDNSDGGEKIGKLEEKKMNKVNIVIQ